MVSRTASLVAREHELDRALHSLRFSGGVLITGEAGPRHDPPRPRAAARQGSAAMAMNFLTDAARYGDARHAAAAVLRQARERLGRAQASAAALATSPLTQRETEVTQLAGRGLSDREIADELVLSIRTVQSHLASAYRKLGIASRSELKS